MPPLTLPAIITPALLKKIRGHPRLPRDCWYIVSSVTLSCLNRPDEIPKVLRGALGEDGDGCGVGERADRGMGHDEQLRIARRMREGLVKSSAICGLPKTINALFALKSATPPSLLDDPMTYSPSSRPSELHNIPPSTILHRGQTFFNTVYGKISKRVMSQMDRSGTEDLGLIARLFYGYVLSNTSILSPAETSLILVAGLVPQDVNPQLKGHLRGAVNNGCAVEEVRAVRDVVIWICEGGGMGMLGEGEMGLGWREEVAKI
ncbi:hypothetical protein EG327_003171 [Venturia inaequalis]|uniref:Carboxymuconolactone decarboxylase-like domain-containing protein n=1 Tax=Venturia inaequalis TaxID=5025 RepID=A0A8H3VK80_VENIN|nr:hypothetical protein EG327_003171 [Venturia inaequalis]